MVNYSILQTTFPGNLKLADITPTQKDSDVTNKKKYRPMSILPMLSKVFERVLENQITTFVNEILFPFMWLQEKIQHAICLNCRDRKDEVIPG